MADTFYTYVYLRSKACANGAVGSPYYVGKGSCTRAYDDHGDYITVPTDTLFILIAADNINEDQAYAYEEALIRWYGRSDIGEGCLLNRNDGGFGGNRHSDETKRKISTARKGRASRPAGWKMTAEQRRRVSAARRLMPPPTEETKRKVSAAKKGCIPWNKGRRWTKKKTSMMTG